MTFRVFLVDTSKFGYRKTSPWYKNLRFNTWLSCETSCWKSVGAQNVYFSDKRNLNRFQIYIAQGPLTPTFAAKRNYVLHYEVEFPCFSSSPPTPDDYNLPSDYIFSETGFGEIFYKRYGRMKISDGRKTCKDDGANLPIPKSAEQNKFFKRFLGGDMWLGMTDENNEGVWIGDDGVVLDWFNWDSGEPNNGFQGEHNVEMYDDGFWNDKGDHVTRNINCVFLIP